jgi:ABC-type multidrug transport system fused ATPase/permease subunit
MSSTRPVVEQGTPGALLAQQGLFHHLYQLQFGDEAPVQA